MDQQDIERITEAMAIAMARALQASRSVSDSEHFDHHRWISIKIKREEEMLKFWSDMRAHLAKWGMVGVASGVLYALYLGVRLWLRKSGVDF